MRRACLPAALVGVISLVLTCPATLAADDRLWDLLAHGGQVILVRHADTTPGVGDPPGMRLDDCSTQRNLSDEGRAHARRVGEAFRAHAIPIARVLSSPWCRCLETSRLAFGEPDVWQPLGNLFGREELRAKQVTRMKKLAAERFSGPNLVLVTHGSTIAALTMISPDPAEMVILTPQGGGRFTIAGQLRVP